MPTPVFDSYINTLTDGDAEITELLLEFIGVCISNVKGWRLKKALFLVGDGDTGKSQLKSLVERLLGRGNFIGIDLKEIEARFGTGAIYGTRLAGSSDMSFLSVDELKTFKKITGGDSLYAEFKGQQAFEFTYNGLLWFCMNRLPKFGGDDGQWVYNRIMVIHCPNVIPKEQQDKQLLDKLYAERDGIVYKAIRALQNVIKNGYRFAEPDIVTIAREMYQAENSTVISFFEECMCERTTGKIEDLCTTGKVFKVYKAWCADNNNGYAKSYREFREQLADHLGTTFNEMIVKRNTGTFYRNFTLTTDAKQQYSQAYGYEDIPPL
jgi:P4 family phage/plasmid primase-like protien